MAAKPTRADLITWLKLQSAPDAATLAVYDEVMAAAIDNIESRITFALTPVANSYRTTLDDGVTTVGLATITSASGGFTTALDAGRPITSLATAIPASTTILSVQSATAATLSAVATASTTLNTFTINPASYPQRIRQAIILEAARLAKRSTSPEGVVGGGVEGIVIRISGYDPDIERLLRRYLKLGGFA